MARKETIKPPTRRELTDAGKQTGKMHSSGARVLAEESVAVREGIRRKKRITKRVVKRGLVLRGQSAEIHTVTRKPARKREYKRSVGKRS
jgi:hypothetical protein